MKRALVILILGAAAIAGLIIADPGFFGLRRGAAAAIVFYGNVDIRQAQLGFRVSGLLAQDLVDEGDAVKSGQILARLDDTPYREQVAAAKATLAAQTATLAKLVAGPLPAEIQKARAAVEQATADLQNAQLAYDRSVQLRPSGAVAQSIVDQAHATRDMAAARLDSAKQDLTLELQGTRPEDLAVGRANVAQAKANLSIAETALADTELRAPADGIVLTRVEEPGAVLAPGATVFTLSILQPVWVRAYVSETELGRIRPGEAVEVYTDSHPNKAYRGVIGFISPVAEFTPKTVETPELRTALVYRFRVTIARPNSGLRQGMPVTIRIPQNNAQARSQP